ncbi:hypothetical protein GOODEAATRI_024374 [Goodea atripinnis]|uniref:Serine-threonine/tyrosine-protein kinase catalytic domain-containing protein n=1 Tax=Goodea atripinnis TaxID=208336 RepID=A0ABV0NDA5_9TELE
MALVYNSSEEKLTAVPGTSLHWPGGSIPLDVPFCGLKNDNPKCLTSQWIIGPNMGPNSVIQNVDQRMKLEKELVAQLWRISWDDIHMSNLDKVLRSGSRITLSLRGSNYGSLMTGDGNLQIFAKTGYYKVSFFLHIPSEICLFYLPGEHRGHKILKPEADRMRDVQNEHLTRFIGACIDPPNICIITEYCPRGSLQVQHTCLSTCPCTCLPFLTSLFPSLCLQDILENDSISLDWMFKYSLINDIVKVSFFFLCTILSPVSSSH